MRQSAPGISKELVIAVGTRMERRDPGFCLPSRIDAAPWWYQPDHIVETGAQRIMPPGRACRPARRPAGRAGRNRGIC